MLTKCESVINVSYNTYTGHFSYQGFPTFPGLRNTNRLVAYAIYKQKFKVKYHRSKRTFKLKITSVNYCKASG